MTRDEALRSGLPLAIGAALGAADERERPDSITAGIDQRQEPEPPARALLPEEVVRTASPEGDTVVLVETALPVEPPSVPLILPEEIAFTGMLPTPATGVLEHLDRLIAKALAKKYGSANTIHAKLGLLESLL